MLVFKNLNMSNYKKFRIHLKNKRLFMQAFRFQLYIQFSMVLTYQHKCGWNSRYCFKLKPL